MTYNITMTIRNATHHAIAYGRNSTEAQWRAVKQACKSYKCAKDDVKVEKVTRRKHRRVKE